VISAPATPDVVKDYHEVTVAQFSGQIGTSPVTGPLGVGSTRWGCTVSGRLDPLDGHIAILDRGGPTPDAGCTFVEKARNAQDAGAIGLLIANNTTGLIIPAGNAPDVTIPVLLMLQTDGQTLKNAVDAGPVTASIVRDPSQGFSGADSSGRALLFAPSTLQPGSSVSHWDTSAFPNLLMEPVINPDLTHTLDLTVPLLRDIGWFSDAGTGGGGVDAGTGGGGGGGGSKSGCTTSSGPPAPWLALLGLLLFVRRKRQA
jgi:MYXO-CTERM domain-containing protein